MSEVAPMAGALGGGDEIDSDVIDSDDDDDDESSDGDGLDNSSDSEDDLDDSDDEDDLDDSGESDDDEVDDEIMDKFICTFSNGDYDAKFDNALNYDRSVTLPVRRSQASYIKPDKSRRTRKSEETAAELSRLGVV
jgi:hypothetical protein